ncbi:sigma-70 family RNA polymerase sigma factor [Halalkalibacter kiskunsagensis]|uniref:RNA polymerase sigma factor n=1 Tax=Halalkalibacter kiskunsagensis TaxID=1548599 RepID=A0ABV6KHN8_9BACI
MSSHNKISDWFYQYSNDIYHYLLYRFGSTDVEDLVQEVFIRAMMGYDSFRSDSSPKTWLFTIARNVAIDENRKKAPNMWKWFIDYDLNLERKQGTLDVSPGKRCINH